MAEARSTPPRAILLQPEALDDLEHWVQEDPRLATKVPKLIEACRREPFVGIGKPEPLKQLASDVWSRRITQQDRLVYRVTEEYIDMLQARYHYQVRPGQAVATVNDGSTHAVSAAPRGSPSILPIPGSGCDRARTAKPSVSQESARRCR